MDTSKVTRVEVIDHTHEVDEGGGRCYTYWTEYEDTDIPNPIVTAQLQDDGRTLKVFISKPI
jgi:hypothetical protein